MTQKILASLPWYDLPSTHRALDEFWRILRQELVNRGIESLPGQLDRSTPLEVQWAQPRLMISQCCSLDLFSHATKSLAPFARPVFADLDCGEGNYFSYIVSQSPANRTPQRLIINAPSSRSGCTALLQWAQDQRLTGLEVVESGSHRASVQHVRQDPGAVAAIDAHSWELLEVEDLCIIDRSREAPAPPFIRHDANVVPAQILFDALTTTIAAAGHLIGMQGVIPCSITDYDVVKGQLHALNDYRSG